MNLTELPEKFILQRMMTDKNTKKLKVISYDNCQENRAVPFCAASRQDRVFDQFLSQKPTFFNF